MEENQTLMNADNDLAPLIPSSSTHYRPQIRRSILRQTTTTRSSPYNAAASNFHRRQTFTGNSSSVAHREEFIENNENMLNVEITDSATILTPPFHVQEHISNGNFSETQEELLQTVDESQESYHSLSTVDFDSDEIVDDHHFYYSSSWSSSSPPVFDNSSFSSEPAPIENHSTNLSRRDQYENDGPSRSSVNENLSSAEDLSIEIILETSQNDTLTNASDYFPSSSTNRPRRRSILPTTIVHHRGLRLSEILSIPQKIYGSIKEQNNEKYPLANSMINTECSICFEDFHSFDAIKILHCQHVFHSECINEWLRNHPKCAYCRASVRIDLLRTTSSINQRPGENRRRQRTRSRRNRHGTTRPINQNSFQPTSFSSNTIPTSRDDQH